MNILITGGEGFIGRNIISYAKNKGWNTISYDIVDGVSEADIKIKASVLNKEKLSEALKNIDIVFHEAATTSPPEFEKNPEIGYEANSQGTFNVLSLSEKLNVKRVVLASSSAMYGNSLKITSENDANLSFISVYSMTKYFNEISGRYFKENTKLETVFLRYFNTYGLGENTKGLYSSIMHKFIYDLKNNKTPVIYGDGNQSRDFIHVKDVARANILAAMKGENGEAYNIGTGITTKFKDIYKIIGEEMDSNIKPKYEPIPFKTYQLYTCANIAKAKKDLNFTPEYDLRSGIKEMVKSI